MGSPVQEIVDLLPEAEHLPNRPGSARGPAWERVVAIRQAFRHGYLVVAAGAELELLAAALATQRDGLRVFAYEGAGMALAIADLISPPAVRLTGQLAAPGFKYGFLGRLGAGWALARLRRPLDHASLGLPLASNADLADGYGFYECFFHRRATLERRVAAVPAAWLTDFDRGVGRGCWFLHEGSVRLIRDTFGAFPDARQTALWTGAGFAAAFAGGVGTDVLMTLAEAAESHLDACRAGAAMAAAVRAAAGDPTPATDLAMKVLGPA